MKLIEKIILVIYSIIILILSCVMCLLIFRWINPETVNSFIFQLINSAFFSIVTLIFSIIFVLMSIKCIFFLSKKSDHYKDNILLKNDDGKLVITKQTIENIVGNIINGFPGLNEPNIKAMFDKENNIIINITILVRENVEIQELSSNIREKVKAIIKKSSGLNVKEVNIKVKNMENKKIV